MSGDGGWENLFATLGDDDKTTTTTTDDNDNHVRTIAGTMNIRQLQDEKKDQMTRQLTW